MRINIYYNHTVSSQYSDTSNFNPKICLKAPYDASEENPALETVMTIRRKQKSKMHGMILSTWTEKEIQISYVSYLDEITLDVSPKGHSHEHHIDVAASSLCRSLRFQCARRKGSGRRCRQVLYFNNLTITLTSNSVEFKGLFEFVILLLVVRTTVVVFFSQLKYCKTAASRCRSSALGKEDDINISAAAWGRQPRDFGSGSPGSPLSPPGRRLEMSECASALAPITVLLLLRRRRRCLVSTSTSVRASVNTNGYFPGRVETVILDVVEQHAEQLYRFQRCRSFTDVPVITKLFWGMISVCTVHMDMNAGLRANGPDRLTYSTWVTSDIELE
ncbi:hypothetical protein F2P81_002209 [Scophthalmus maximus]|uniref:Uncharacterized protein n=1 Tax=Scophthalmus maximus TaxID=52904 RepID=A0A6A4TQ33_SCOMX|nr:hypothetical protein F2P81_002209 [Scophthalmus maximus]